MNPKIQKEEKKQDLQQADAQGLFVFIKKYYQLYRNWKKSRGRQKRDFKRFQKRKQFYSNFVKTGDLCFDVGANLGNRSEVFLELGATVVAVEPQEKCAQLLKEKFGTHPKFTLIEKALDKQEGTTEFYISNAHTLSSMSLEWIDFVRKENLFEGANWNSKTVVHTTTLDALVEAYGSPVFCKIDVEGSEINVLRGLSKPIGVISFEFAWQLDGFASACIQSLEKIGYHRFNYAIGETMSLALKEWVDADEMINIISKKKKAKDQTGGDIYSEP